MFCHCKKINVLLMKSKIVLEKVLMQGLVKNLKVYLTLNLKYNLLVSSVFRLIYSALRTKSSSEPKTLKDDHVGHSRPQTQARMYLRKTTVFSFNVYSIKHIQDHL